MRGQGGASFSSMGADAAQVAGTGIASSAPSYYLTEGNAFSKRMTPIICLGRSNFPPESRNGAGSGSFIHSTNVHSGGTGRSLGLRDALVLMRDAEPTLRLQGHPDRSEICSVKISPDDFYPHES